MKMKHIKTEAAPVSGQHTPTPWFLDGNYIQRDEYGGLIARAHTDNPANAEFIVRACNCHEELVRTLQLVVNCQNYTMDGSPVSYELQAALTEARAALNKASR